MWQGKSENDSIQRFVGDALFHFYTNSKIMSMDAGITPLYRAPAA